MIPVLGGLPRSGSTLISALLRQNPAIEVTPTGFLMGLIESMRHAYTQNPARVSWLDQGEALRRFNASVSGACHGYLQPPVPGGFTIAKERGWPALSELIEQAAGEPPRIILPVRDLRGIASSLERQRRRHPEIAGPADDCPALGARIAHWFSAGVAPAGTAITNVLEASQRGIIDKSLVVRYEDLCQSPEHELARIYDYLGYELPPGIHDIENVNEPLREHDAVHGPLGDHVIPTGPVRCHEPDWNDILGDDLAGELVSANPWYYRTFYPEQYHGHI